MHGPDNAVQGPGQDVVTDVELQLLRLGGFHDRSLKFWATVNV